MKRSITRAIRALAWGIAILGSGLDLFACAKAKPTALYETVAVEKRTIVLSATAAGAIEPVTTVEVKSKASGEIIEMKVETGDEVSAKQLLARIDPREPRNTLAQAQANVEVAQAQLANAKSEMARADTFYKRQVITQVEFENARLAYATANAAVVRSESELENAHDQMDDTEIRAPVAGTVIAKNVELGTVISSPTRDVGGGTVLLRMADLDTVQIRAFVDETDIGKVVPGLAATISVDSYPDRQFEGAVLKVEPLATVQQNVTMFPVLVRLANPGHLLKPGMTAEVEIHVGRRDDVLAIPYSALRTSKDVASAATVLGMDPQEVQTQLASASSGAATPGASGAATPGAAASANGASTPGAAAAPGDSAARDSSAAASKPAGNPGNEGKTMVLRNGNTVTLPPGVSEDDVRKIMSKRASGAELSSQESALLRKLFQGGGGRGGGGMGRGGSRAGRATTTQYIVFVLREGKPTPIQIQTGLTDLDYVEVLSGLSEGDQVLILPSASLVNSQKEMKERFQRMTGGGLPGVQQQTPTGQRTNQTR